MKLNNINLSGEAVNAIVALQHPCGTYSYYDSALARLFNYIFNQSEEMGMDDVEAMGTLRALNALRSDLAAIAGPPSALPNATPAECIAKTFDGISDTYHPEPIDITTESNASPGMDMTADGNVQ